VMRIERDWKTRLLVESLLQVACHRHVNSIDEVPRRQGEKSNRGEQTRTIIRLKLLITTLLPFHRSNTCHLCSLCKTVPRKTSVRSKSSLQRGRWTSMRIMTMRVKTISEALDLEELGTAPRTACPMGSRSKRRQRTKVSLRSNHEPEYCPFPSFFHHHNVSKQHTFQKVYIQFCQFIARRGFLRATKEGGDTEFWALNETALGRLVALLHWISLYRGRGSGHLLWWAQRGRPGSVVYDFLHRAMFDSHLSRHESLFNYLLPTM